MKTFHSYYSLVNTLVSLEMREYLRECTVITVQEHVTEYNRIHSSVRKGLARLGVTPRTGFSTRVRSPKIRYMAKKLNEFAAATVEISDRDNPARLQQQQLYFLELWDMLWLYECTYVQEQAKKPWPHW